VKSHTTPRFRKLLARLTPEMRRQAHAAYQRFMQDPFHTGLNFELIDAKDDLWSARVNDYYRVLGYRDRDEITWFWIGTHGEYDRLIG